MGGGLGSSLHLHPARSGPSPLSAMLRGRGTALNQILESFSLSKNHMYCLICGIEGGMTCPSCGRSLVPSGAIKESDETVTIKLWNSDIAAVLSWLFFGLCFGALVHAMNWHQLNQRRRVWESMAWAMLPLFSIGVIAVVGGPHGRPLPMKLIVFIVNAALVASWYFISGREQSKFIHSQLQNRYIRKSWASPVIFALTAMFLLFVIL